jgi:hypothetical protein
MAGIGKEVAKNSLLNKPLLGRVLALGRSDGKDFSNRSGV